MTRNRFNLRRVSGLLLVSALAGCAAQEASAPPLKPDSMSACYATFAVMLPPGVTEIERAEIGNQIFRKTGEFISAESSGRPSPPILAATTPDIQGVLFKLAPAPTFNAVIQRNCTDARETAERLAASVTVKDAQWTPPQGLSVTVNALSETNGMISLTE